MVRESLFNILRDRIDGARFLDLFCGTGAVGIEALSRGASHVTFNDNNSKSLNCLNKNLTSLKISDGYSVSIRDGLAFLLISIGLIFVFFFLSRISKSIKR
jgi:16S rRNA (guanine966-N2)-methyltransferase